MMLESKSYNPNPRIKRCIAQNMFLQPAIVKKRKNRRKFSLIAAGALILAVSGIIVFIILK